MKPRLAFQVDAEQELKIRETAKKLGIGISTLCRMSVMEKAKEILEKKEAQNDGTG